MGVEEIRPSQTRKCCAFPRWKAVGKMVTLLK